MFNIDLPDPWVIWTCLALILLVACYHYRKPLLALCTTKSTSSNGGEKKHRKYDDEKLSHLEIARMVVPFVVMIIWGAYLVFKVPNYPTWPIIVCIVVSVISWLCAFLDGDYDMLQVTVITVISFFIMSVAIMLLAVNIHNFVLWGAVVAVAAFIATINEWKEDNALAKILMIIFAIMLIVGTCLAMNTPVQHWTSTYIAEGLILFVVIVLIIAIVKEDEDVHSLLLAMSFCMAFFIVGFFLLINWFVAGLIWTCVVAILLAIAGKRIE